MYRKLHIGGPDVKGSIQLGPHTLICGDAREQPYDIAHDAALIYDPPYDDAACAALRWRCQSALVFTDPNRHFTTLAADWELPLRWVFTWDTLNPLWVSATQPLRRSKLCLWLGHDTYSQDGELYGEPPAAHRRRARIGAAGTGGPWKEGFYTPDPRGKHLATVYAASKTALGGHPHAKPEEWIRLLLATCCADQDVVFDPFAGGGSSLIAADRLGKQWIGIERDPAWCEAIVQRYEQRGDGLRPNQLALEWTA